MDLFAYAQIEDLAKIAKDNGIEIPRLRGYRLMKNEESVSQEEIKDIMSDEAIDIVKTLCCARPFWNPKAMCHEYSSYTDYLREFYLVKDKNEDGRTIYTDIRWNRIHGKKRKILKFEIKKRKKAIQKQFDIWNKYVGQNVLYIHSRVGGGNWENMSVEDKIKLTNAPWFLDRVDDYLDNTYCDFYASIKEEHND